MGSEPFASVVLVLCLTSERSRRSPAGKPAGAPERAPLQGAEAASGTRCASTELPNSVLCSPPPHLLSALGLQAKQERPWLLFLMGVKENVVVIPVAAGCRCPGTLGHTNSSLVPSILHATLLRNCPLLSLDTGHGEAGSMTPLRAG